MARQNKMLFLQILNFFFKSSNDIVNAIYHWITLQLTGTRLNCLQKNSSTDGYMIDIKIVYIIKPFFLNVSFLPH